MHNGYQIDPLSILHDQLRDQSRTLLDLTHAAGRIEQRLTDGSEFHKEVRDHLADHGTRLTVIETNAEKEEPKSRIKSAVEAVRLLAPFVMLAISVLRAIVLLYGKDALAAHLEQILGYVERLQIE